MNALFARTNAPSEAEFVNKQVSPVTIVHQVFIGHGRSSTWREVKDFVQDRLRVKVQEFNSESAAGLPTQQRLQELLDTSTFALLIMTAEDEKADGKRAARPNVIHEIGLFQGRLGFARAIVILENGCDEFSNIVGLTQLRFDPGNIATVFEEIRKVMEREGVIRAG
jgi:predicted nucleotide-binding protein